MNEAPYILSLPWPVEHNQYLQNTDDTSFESWGPTTNINERQTQAVSSSSHHPPPPCQFSFAEPPRIFEPQIAAVVYKQRTKLSEKTPISAIILNMKTPSFC